MNLIATTTASVSNSVQNARRRLLVLVAVAGLSVGAAMTAGPAAAYTTLTSGSTTFVSFGFECDANYHWVRENWPNIIVPGAGLQEVYVKTYLSRWNGTGWTVVKEGAWYRGVSNNNGRQVLGQFYGGQPYYFATNTTPSNVASLERQEFFLNLPSGYYSTVEDYWTPSTGYKEAKNLAVAGTNQGYCKI
jgi:hypothetical protein